MSYQIIYRKDPGHKIRDWMAEDEDNGLSDYNGGYEVDELSVTNIEEEFLCDEFCKILDQNNYAYEVLALQKINDFKNGDYDQEKLTDMYVGDLLSHKQ